MCSCDEKQTQADGFKALESFIAKFDDKQSALIKVLYEAQHIFGFLSKDTMMFVGEKLGVPASKVFGVVSFYSYFTTKPKGRHQVKVCLGTACFVRGADKIAGKLEQELGLKMGETSADGEFSLEALRCVGACGLAPVVLVDEHVHGKLVVDDVSKMLKTYKSGGANA